MLLIRPLHPCVRKSHGLDTSCVAFQENKAGTLIFNNTLFKFNQPNQFTELVSLSLRENFSDVRFLSSF